MRFMTFFLAISFVTLLAGCAGQPHNSVPQPSFVSPVSEISPIMYETYDCEQIHQEAKNLRFKAQAVSGIIDDNTPHKGVVIWPTALLSQDNLTQKAELVRMRNQFEALEKASVREECRFKFQRANSASVEQTSAWTLKITRQKT